MRHPPWRLLVPLCAALALSRVLAEQPSTSSGRSAPGFAVIDGLVTDSALVPIECATVTIVQTSIHVETGASGRFQIRQVPAGRYLLSVRRLGFREVSAILIVLPNDTLRLAYAMEPSVLDLDAAVITERESIGRLAGFEYRRAHEVGGKYITRAQIEAQAPTETTDLLRRLSGIKIVDSSRVMVAISSRGYKTEIIGGQVVPVPCTLPIVVDGIQRPGGFTIDMIPPNDIYGIEVYVGPASIPPEFNSARKDGFCGVIMIWTRTT
jgi:hypothetical protein